MMGIRKKKEQEGKRKELKRKRKGKKRHARLGIEKRSLGGLKALGYDFRDGDDRLVAQPNHYTTEWFCRNGICWKELRPAT